MEQSKGQRIRYEFNQKKKKKESDMNVLKSD